MVAVLMMATESDAKMTSRWRLGWVLPCLMLVVMAMEFALRLAPLDVSRFPVPFRLGVGGDWRDDSPDYIRL